MVLCAHASALHRRRERDQRLATVVRNSNTGRATAGCSATITAGWSTCFQPFVGWNTIRAGCHSFCVEIHSRANDLQEGDSLPFDELGPFDGVPSGHRETNVALCGVSAACGLSLAGIYPLMMARLLKQSGSTRGIGWVLASASVGGASLPWLTGFASTLFGSLRAAMVVPALAVSLLLALVPRIYSKGNRSVPWHPGGLTHHKLG